MLSRKGKHIKLQRLIINIKKIFFSMYFQYQLLLSTRPQSLSDIKSGKYQKRNWKLSYTKTLVLGEKQIGNQAELFILGIFYFSSLHCLGWYQLPPHLDGTSRFGVKLPFFLADPQQSPVVVGQLRVYLDSVFFQSSWNKSNLCKQWARFLKQLLPQRASIQRTSTNSRKI